MIAVSNSSPIMNLAAIGRLDLIKLKFKSIAVPDAVWKEVVIDGKGNRGVGDIENADWVKVQSTRNKALVQVLKKDLAINFLY